MNISQFLAHLYWVSKFGRPKRKVSAESLFAHPELLENPVFFLSTGRCGTEWFTHLLQNDKQLAVFHNPYPNLSVQNKFMFELSHQPKKEVIVTGKQLVFAGRESYFRYAVKTEKRYVETNNHITFFADSLAELFPTAQFLHLYRHPGDFVTSGLNRGWFDENNDATQKMITSDESAWNSLTQLEKVAWVWNGTNGFIEDFKRKNPERITSYDFTKRSPEALEQVLQFLNVRIDRSTILKSLDKKRNVQKHSQHPKYTQWEDADKERLRKICGDLAWKYDYDL